MADLGKNRSVQVRKQSHVPFCDQEFNSLQSHRQEGEVYGETRLLSALTCQAAGTPEKIAQELRVQVSRSVTLFSDDADPYDDITFQSFTFGRT